MAVTNDDQVPALSDRMAPFLVDYKERRGVTTDI